MDTKKIYIWAGILMVLLALVFHVGFLAIRALGKLIVLALVIILLLSYFKPRPRK